ncbi:MAG: hypothetical protein ACK49V_04850 [Actinomycetes bacterium]
MKLHWKIGGAMAIIAALVSAGGGVAAYRSTDSELNENIDRSLLDSAQRVVGRAFDRGHDEDNESHHENRENDDGADENDDEEEVVPPPIRQSDVCPLALLQPVDAAQLIYPDGTFEPCFTGSPVLPIDDEDLEQAAGDDGDGDIDSVHLHTVSVDGLEQSQGAHVALTSGRRHDDVVIVVIIIIIIIIVVGLVGAVVSILVRTLVVLVVVTIERPTHHALGRIQE